MNNSSEPGKDKDSLCIDEFADEGAPATGTKTQSPSPLQPASRRTSCALVPQDLSSMALQRDDASPHHEEGLLANVYTPVQGVPGGLPLFDRNNPNSPVPSLVNCSLTAHPAATGRCSPTHFTNSVAASVVRNALPQDGGASPDLLAGLSQRLAGTLHGTDYAYGGLEGAHADGASASSSARGTGGFDDRCTSPAYEALTPNGSQSPMAMIMMGSPGAGSYNSIDPGLLSSDLSSFSRERAEKNFAKARDLLLEHIKSQERSRKGADTPAAGAVGAAGDDEADEAEAEADGERAVSESAAVGDGSTPSEPSHGTRASPPPAAVAVAVEGKDSGGAKLYNVIRAAMDEADSIDDAEANATANHHNKADWRDDDEALQSPSAFFQSAAGLESTSNRVMETIIAKGHAAATDDELRWLYRHAHLLNLLETQDLRKIASVSLRREFMNGETIANQYTNMRHLYIVVWGDVEVFRPTSPDQEQRALESSFRMTGVEEQYHSLSVNSGDTGGGSLARSSIHDLLGIQTSNRARSRSVASGFAMDSNEDGGGGGGGGEGGVAYTHIATLLPGQVFGTESFVFDQTNHFVFRAGGSTKKTVVSLVPFPALEPSLAANPRFAQGVGSAIAGSVDVFGPIRQFCRYVFSSQTSQNDYLPLWSIVAAYTQINNVIHTKLSSTELDTGAWGYALNRLPENVTSTFCFDLVHALPPFVASRMRVEAYAADVSKAPEPSAGVARARTAVAFIRTKERRRCTWHLGMEGKDLVLLRDGFTDLLDFLTMLCVHIIESNKLRGRVQGMVHPPAIDILDSYLRLRDKELAESKVVPMEEEVARIKQVLSRMPLTSDEQNGLLRNWGHETLLKIYEVMMHREEFNVRVDPSISRKFQINPFHEWALNLRGCVMQKLGLDRAHELPNDLCIDVVSSNTHCIKNLLCSFNRKYKKEILDYAVRKEGKKLGRPEEWHIVEDMIYVATRGFLYDERPDLKEEYQKSLEDNGITVLRDTAMTGLQVDVIPVHSLDFDTIDETIHRSLRDYFERTVEQHGSREGSSGGRRKQPTWAQVSKPRYAPGTSPVYKQQERFAGPSSPPSSPPSVLPGFRLPRHFIINMDFAFGAQAEGICRAIFSAFGKRIRSVNVMGKAGGLQGKRGDIQLASHVLLSKSSLILEDNQDELRNCRNQDLTKERLQQLAGPNVVVHHGKVLTVTGTMLQNVPLLRYYKNVWRCVGTEMEGSYFARVIEDFYRQGIANTELHTHFAYYTSDLPLAQSEAADTRNRTKATGNAAATLSAPMTPQEGVPPLYAIARGILENVLLT